MLIEMAEANVSCGL